ncbi:MAG: hypothetical protein VW338_05740, partial [Rhodospirillaceae bacterium]
MDTPSEFQPAAPASPELRQSAFLSNDVRRGRHSRAYSRFVSLMKFLLPVVALLLIALIVAWPHINTGDIGFR